jgi:hypothetical protein
MSGTARRPTIDEVLADFLVEQQKRLASLTFRNYADANVGEFLDYFMIRKVMASEELLRTADTVTTKLAKWLGVRGYLDESAVERTRLGTWSRSATSTRDDSHWELHPTAAIVIPSAVAAASSASSPATTTRSGSLTRSAAARCTAS